MLKSSLIFVILAVLSPLSWASAKPVSHIIDTQAMPTEDDNYLDLGFRKPPMTRISDFGSQLARFGRASFRPWNGSYWPTYKGMLAHRYNDSGFPNSDTWSVNHSYYLASPSSLLVASGRLNALSPAEKYDLLLEDSNWTLTNKMWAKGSVVQQMYGKVPKWFGICHGWSAANHMRVPEAGHPITAVSVHGNYHITFYPTDIKALESYLWAESSPNSLFIGRRCRANGNPQKDASGRIIDKACFDNNPMTWHLAVINRVGRDGDSMVMDSSMDGQVWNYAVDSFYYRFFDPRTLRPTKSWKEAMVSRQNYTADPFKAYRSEGMRYVVGVVMDVYFPAATEPTTTSRADSTVLLKSKKFVYDLELDERFNVIGGEWHSKERPDFLWTFPYTATAATAWDSGLMETWDDGTALPQSWADAAQKAALKGKVLASIANVLLNRSLVDEGSVSPRPPPEDPTPTPEPEPLPDPQPLPEPEE